MNLSRNEKITLMLLLIGILVVIYLYTNKQEKLDNTNDNQIISQCVTDFINNFPPEYDYKRNLYTQFKQSYINTLLQYDGPFMQEKYIQNEIYLDAIFNENKRRVDFLNTFKNIAIIDDNTMRILILYKNNNSDSGIAIFDFNKINFVLYTLNSIDIIYKTYENDDIFFGIRINNNNFIIETKSTENITIDLILKLQLENGNISLLQYLNDKVKPINIAVIIQKIINNQKINKCIQNKLLSQQALPPTATPPTATPPTATPPSATPQAATPQAATPQAATDIVNKLKENAVTIISSSNEDIRKVLTDTTNTYFCVFEGGNITTVKYDNNKLSLVYSSYYDIASTVSLSSYKLLLQYDGNLVLYYTDMSSNQIPFWSTGTYSFGPSSMSLDQNGNLIIKANNGQGVWNSSKNTTNNILKLESKYSEKKNQRFMDELSSFLVEINSQQQIAVEKSTPVTTGTVSTESITNIQTPQCIDNNQWCSDWASKGECKNNPDYMLYNCAKSCNSCDKLQSVATPQPIMSDKNQMCAEFIENIKNKDVELNTFNVMYKDQLQKINAQNNLIQQQSQENEKLKQMSDISNIQLINSDNNYIYKLDSKDNIYYCKKPCNNNWQQIPGSLRQITSDNKNLYGVNSQGNIYTCLSPCSNGKWQQIPGGLKSIDANQNNYLYGVNQKNNSFICQKPCLKGNWTKIL
jgi:hypothetical protein